MNTFLSPSQERERQQYLDFARAEIASVAAELENNSEKLKTVLAALGQAGYLGLIAPKDYGGQGQPLLNLVFLVEAISRYEPGLALTIAVHCSAIELLSKYGTERQKSRYLPLLARGESMGTVAWYEEQAGTDFQDVKTAAVASADGFSLSGIKTGVVNGDICGLILVLARQENGHLGIFLVDKSRDSAVKVLANQAKLGLRSSSSNDVHLNGLHIAIEDQLGPDKPAAEQVFQALSLSAVILSAAAVGLSDSGLDSAAEHARLRQQFGQPIGQFQAVQWKLADMSVDVAAARILTYRAAWSKEEDPAQFNKQAALCKWVASRVARFQSGEALQILGAQGLSDSCLLQRLYRDAKALEIVEGTSEFHKMTLVKELGI